MVDGVPYPPYCRVEFIRPTMLTRSKEVQPVKHILFCHRCANEFAPTVQLELVATGVKKIAPSTFFLLRNKQHE